ncbi:hypothetical protein HH308_06290 [Gordonia sp. TBRC 11910]|uniref:Uncharacterized protein n=1 Tax=Gordonia asplenii TaxID=2725283 RepID=A0A848KXA6_9ACTN|nr:hypothetical protein [Gordonia asplenii]NMO00821.1 hypothetical protein [Gordonia asplenii]
MPTILADNADHAAQLAKLLLDEADDPADVKTVTSGSTIAFDVPDSLAEAITKLAEPKKAPAKKAAPKAPAKTEG